MMNATQQPKPEIAIPAWVPRIFLEACGEHRQFDVMVPFARDFCLWATDGTILVRRRLSSKERADFPMAWYPKDRRLPNAMDIWQRFALLENLPHVAPLPPGKYEPTECSNCGGQGINKLGLECDECDGEGVVESCFRVPIRERPAVVLLSRYVGMLLRHGVSYVRAGESAVPVHFAGHGFEGVLMTCKETKP